MVVKKRTKIGLLFTGNYQWVGGLYYILNIIKSLNYLDEDNKPEIILFYSNETPKELLHEVKYPYLEKVNINKYNLFLRAIYKGVLLITHRNFQLEHVVNPYNLAGLYPFNEYNSELDHLHCKRIYWIYDFQHKLLPVFFSKKEINHRDRIFHDIAKNADDIVVSSYDAKSHFKKYYPESKARIHVLRFVSIIDTNNTSDFNDLKTKYQIDRPFFIVSNQFWQHKNHFVVLNAICTLIKQNYKDISVIFTGKEYDHRNPDYFLSIKNFINKNNLTQNIKILGFISRNDQLNLMKNSIAVIQPSKFEGWSTVVEDAKSLEKHIILSDIAVHKEQMGANGHFFEPDDSLALAEIILKFKQNQISGNPSFHNINVRIKTFAKDFMKIFDD